MRIWSVLRWQTVGLLLAMLAIVGLPYMVNLSSSRDTQQAAAWVTHSTAVKALIYRIAYEVHDSEVAGYRLLAGEDDGVTRKRAAHANAEAMAQLQQLRIMTLDNPDQQVMIGSLANSVNSRIALMNQAMARLDKGDVASARQSLRDADSMFDMNAQIRTIVEAEDHLLDERRIAAKQQAFDGRVVLTLTMLAQILLLAIIVVASERQIVKRQLAETREGQAVLRSQRILQAVREPIALFDMHLNSLLINNAFGEMYGMDTQLRAQPLTQIAGGAWNDSVLLQRLNDVLLHDRELWDYDVVQRTVGDVERNVVQGRERIEFLAY
ncbi:MAG: CHASE3 domain-containing protein, partial [Rhodanobacter sp.]